MNPLPAPTPSWLSTVVFALLVLLYCFLLGFGWVDTLLPPVAEPQNGELQSHYTRGDRENVALQMAAVVAVAGAALAAWGWRAPRDRRFHLCYFTGLALFAATFFYVWSHYQYVNAVIWGLGSAHWHEGFELEVLPVPIIAAFTTTTALVLMLVALGLDRPDRPAR